MIEEIGDPINVEVLFQSGKVYPRYFSWHRRIYKITGITSQWSEPEGQFRRYHFTVSVDPPNIYELRLSTRTMLWVLASIYYGE